MEGCSSRHVLHLIDTCIYQFTETASVVAENGQVLIIGYF
jgi:hypothetical protein